MSNSSFFGVMNKQNFYYPPSKTPNPTFGSINGFYVENELRGLENGSRIAGCRCTFGIKRIRR